MQRWRIVGADETTGRDVVTEVIALSAADAEAIVRSRGVLVSRVEAAADRVREGPFRETWRLLMKDTRTLYAALLIGATIAGVVAVRMEQSRRLSRETPIDQPQGVRVARPELNPPEGFAPPPAPKHPWLVKNDRLADGVYFRGATLAVEKIVEDGTLFEYCVYVDNASGKSVTIDIQVEFLDATGGLVKSEVVHAILGPDPSLRLNQGAKSLMRVAAPADARVKSVEVRCLGVYFK